MAVSGLRLPPTVALAAELLEEGRFSNDAPSSPTQCGANGPWRWNNCCDVAISGWALVRIV
jgi:hypothetical protein